MAWRSKRLVRIKTLFFILFIIFQIRYQILWHVIDLLTHRSDVPFLFNTLNSQQGKNLISNWDRLFYTNMHIRSMYCMSSQSQAQAQLRPRFGSFQIDFNLPQKWFADGSLYSAEWTPRGKLETFSDLKSLAIHVIKGWAGKKPDMKLPLYNACMWALYCGFWIYQRQSRFV